MRKPCNGSVLSVATSDDRGKFLRFHRGGLAWLPVTGHYVCCEHRQCSISCHPCEQRVVRTGDKFHMEALAFFKPSQPAFLSAADLGRFIPTAHDERVDALPDESLEDLCRAGPGGDPVDAPPPHFPERLGQVPNYPHGGSVFSRLAEEPSRHTGEPLVGADELPLGKGTYLSCRPFGCPSPARRLGRRAEARASRAIVRRRWG